MKELIVIFFAKAVLGLSYIGFRMQCVILTLVGGGLLLITF